MFRICRERERERDLCLAYFSSFFPLILVNYYTHSIPAALHKSTAYQSQKDCKTGETFSSNGTANGNICGKCAYQCSDYTLTSKKNENCYSCTPCPYDSSKYKCTESVKSDYQLVNGVCSKIPNTEPEPNPVACSSGYTAGLTSCTEKAGYTSSYTSDGYVGGKICGKCDYTARTCPNGYSTKYSSVSACGNTGSNGWKYASNGYSGEAVCGKCTAKACSNGYSTKYSSVSACGSTGSNGWKYASNGYSGEAVCGKCDYTARTCPDGYSTKYSSVSACGNTGSNGWNYASNGYSGDAVCGKCTAKTCPSGYYTFYSSVKSCGSTGSEGWNYSTNGYSGNKVCGKCASKTCPSGYTCKTYSDDLLKEPCNTSTRCPGNSGYYTSKTGGNTVIVDFYNCDKGFWAHPAGRCGDGICMQYGRRTCPNGGISRNEVSSPDSYCKNKYATSRWDKLHWWAKFMENSDGTLMCSGTQVCQECYRD